MPDTAPGSIGPPKSDKSTAIILVISSCEPFQTPAPTKISPVLPSESKIPFESKSPNSSPLSNPLIESSKINSVDSPVSDISTLKC